MEHIIVFLLFLILILVVCVQVEARINEEAERATHYLDESTESRIVEVRPGRHLSIPITFSLHSRLLLSSYVSYSLFFKFLFQCHDKWKAHRWKVLIDDANKWLLQLSWKFKVNWSLTRLWRSNLSDDTWRPLSRWKGVVSFTCLRTTGIKSILFLLLICELQNITVVAKRKHQRRFHIKPYGSFRLTVK